MSSYGDDAKLLKQLLVPNHLTWISLNNCAILEAAQGDPAKLSLAGVDLAYPALSDGERSCTQRIPRSRGDSALV